MGYGKAVIMNSSDTFADEYYSRYGTIDDVFTGINQETIITSVDYDDDTFGWQTEEDCAYFKDYVERYAALGADIYLLGATDADVIAEIKAIAGKRVCILRGGIHRAGMRSLPQGHAWSLFDPGMPGKRIDHERHLVGSAGDGWPAAVKAPSPSLACGFLMARCFPSGLTIKRGILWRQICSSIVH